MMADKCIGDKRRLREIVEKNFHSSAWFRLTKKYSSIPVNSQAEALLKIQDGVYMM